MIPFRVLSASLLLLSLAACNGNGTGATVPQSAVAPTGIQATGSAGTTGGAAAAAPGTGAIATTPLRR